ncbi:MAG: PPA1309 family protein [Actinomycetaceae bacterium]|nr:PPA1309 family protein [Actinomycetaceae bacterium]
MNVTSSSVSPVERALRHTVVEIEKSAASLGWDRASTVYALVPTISLLELDELPDDMRSHLRKQWDGTSDALTAVIQEDLPGIDLEDTLAQLGWPDSVAGAAVCTERVMVPTDVQAAAPDDPVEAVEFFANHPERDDVRIVAGVMRTGEIWCAVRTRSHDHDDEVAQGDSLVPGLTDALLTTFAPAEERISYDGDGSCGNCGCGSNGCGQ